MTQLSLAMIHNQVILPNTSSIDFGEASEESFAAEWAKMDLKATGEEGQTSVKLQTESPEAVLVERSDAVADRSGQKAPKSTQFERGNAVSVARGAPEDDILDTPGAIGQSAEEQDSASKLASPQSDLRKSQLPTEQKATVQHIVPDPGDIHPTKQVSAEPIQSKAPQSIGQPVVLNRDAKSDSAPPIGSPLHNLAPAQESVSLENPVQDKKLQSLPISTSAPAESTKVPQPAVTPAMRPVAEIVLQGVSTQAVQGQTAPPQTALPIQMALNDISTDKHPQTIHPDLERVTLETVRPEPAPRQSPVSFVDSLKVVRPQTSEQQPTFGDKATYRTEFLATDRTEVLRYEPQGSVPQVSTTVAPTQPPPVFFGAPKSGQDLSVPADQFSVLPVAEPDTKTAVSTISPQAAPSKPELAQVVIRQLAVVVPQVSDRPVEVLLNPEELGRVRMVMLGQDAQMVVQIHADKPETSDLIRRHLDMLAQDFQELGYSDISFSFSNQRENNEPSHDETSADTSLPIQLTDTPTAPQLLLPQSGLDLRL